MTIVVYGFSSHLKNVHSYGDVTFDDKGLQILTYARHSWPLSSKGSLKWHTYILWHGTSVYNGHLRGPVTLTPTVERFSSGAVTACFFSIQVYCGWDSNTQPSACEANTPKRSHMSTMKKRKDSFLRNLISHKSVLYHTDEC